LFVDQINCSRASDITPECISKQIVAHDALISDVAFVKAPSSFIGVYEVLER